MNRIAEYRKAKGWNQHELSKRLQVAQTTISGWERGYREPDNASLEKLQKELDVPIAKFIGWEPDEERLYEADILRSSYGIIQPDDYPEIISISEAADCMDKDQRARLLIIAKAAFPGAFSQAEQKYQH
jgi:transcriptional regulator with XRE-family HTH domain